MRGEVQRQGRRTKLPTPHHARPSEWDKRKGRIKGASGYAIAVNAQLAEKIADFDLIASRMVEGTAADITTNDIRVLLGNKPIAERPAQKRIDATIEEIFDRYIDFIKATDKRGNTIRNYGTNKRTICGFARARYGQLVTVRDINLGFVTELLKYLRDERKNNNGTIAKRLEKTASCVLKWHMQ